MLCLKWLAAGNFVHTVFQATTCISFCSIMQMSCAEKAFFDFLKMTDQKNISERGSPDTHLKDKIGDPLVRRVSDKYQLGSVY